MDDVIEDALVGLEYWDDSVDRPRFVQAVIFADSQVLILFDYWWRGDPLPGTSLYVMQNYPTKRDDGWYFDTESNPRLTPPSDEDSADTFRQMREAMRAEFSKYMLALDRMQAWANGDDVDEAVPQFDFTPWFAQVQELGELDPVIAYKQEAHGKRPVTYVRVIDNSGNPVDAACFDDRGVAASVQSSGPLAGYVAAFESHAPETRPSAGQYAEWLKNQSLYGPYSIDHVGATEAEGDVETIASQAMTLSI